MSKNLPIVHFPYSHPDFYFSTCYKLHAPLSFVSEPRALFSLRLIIANSWSTVPSIHFEWFILWSQVISSHTCGEKYSAKYLRLNLCRSPEFCMWEVRSLHCSVLRILRTLVSWALSSCLSAESLAVPAWVPPPHTTAWKTLSNQERRAVVGLKVNLAQPCLTVCDPMNCSLPGSSVHGILQARILVRVAIPFFRGSSQPRDWPKSPTLQADSLPCETSGKLSSLSGTTLIPCFIHLVHFGLLQAEG